MSNAKANTLLESQIYDQYESIFSENAFPFGKNVNFKLGLCNYATKFDVKKATGVDTSAFVKKFSICKRKRIFMNQILIN